jgi:hypothetical protein
MGTMRPELEPLPSRMQRLPIDERGYVVPWFVDWIDGKPEFRAMDLSKWVRAVREKLCWVCGQQLGVHLAFVIGPMCGINRTTSEPPCHLECAQWSARNCPFLTQREVHRREEKSDAFAKGAGCPIDRQPGVACIWISRSYSIFDDGRGGKLVHLHDPERVEWYAHGRQATREEVEASINSGLPILEKIAREQDEKENAGALAHLAKLQTDFSQWLPA